MKLSRISRGLIVAIFVTITIFLGIIDVKLIFQESNPMYSTVSKLVYIVLVFSLTMIYIYIKDKLYKMKIKRKIAFIYRYVYLITLILISRYIIIINTIETISFGIIFFNILFTIITALIVKRIVFNISKSDMLSVVATVSFAMNLNVINNTQTLTLAMIVSFITLTIIITLQFLIDELKQKGIKTKKYIIYSLLIGLEMGISLIFGINIMVWVLLLLLLIFITIDLDYTHINFPKKIINSLSTENKDRLYKLERININKILISIVISFFAMVIIYKTGILLLQVIPENTIIGILKSNIKDILKINTTHVNISNFIGYCKFFLNLSKSYYLCLIIYILILESLSFFLRRRYDTKTTIIKAIFINLFVMVYVLKLNILYFQPLFNILLVIIAIINTSSIYLNREERIKMLVA